MSVCILLYFFLFAYLAQLVEFAFAISLYFPDWLQFLGPVSYPPRKGSLSLFISVVTFKVITFFQVDYLQQTNQELEDRIRELEDGKSVAILESQRMRSEVDRLHDELRSIDRLAQQLEQEKQVTS